MINPVRATSPELILERMKKSGAPVSVAVARQLASQSKAALLNRIAAYRSTAGQGMPLAGEVLHWLAFINSQCPDCEPPEWPL
jgi:hypothetical protein